MKQTLENFSFAAWMARETYRWTEGAHEAIDPVMLQYRNETESAKSKVRPLLDLPRPLDVFRDAHAKVFSRITGLRTSSQLIAYQQLMLSELLCAFPLRRSHWGDMRITEDLVPDNPRYNSLHIYPSPQGDGKGRYALVAPVSAFKNRAHSERLKTLDPPRIIYNLGEWLDPMIHRYFAEVWPHLDDGKTANRLFTIATEEGLYQRFTEFQRRHLLPHIPLLTRPWGFHPYRVVVATHAIKNAKDKPITVSADLLVDSEYMIRRVYGHYRPEDGHDLGREATAPPAGNEERL